MAGDVGLDQRLRDLVGAPPPSVELGTVDEVEAFAGGYLVTCTVQPSGRKVQARLAALGAGDGTGLYWPLAVGDEVLLLFPGGDANRAVAIPGWRSTAAPKPSTDDQTGPGLVHPRGFAVRTSGAGMVQGVVLESFLDAFRAVLTELAAVGAAAAVPTPNATALNAALGTTAHRSTALKTE